MAVLLAVLALCLDAHSVAQSTSGTIRGTVQDGSGAVIPDAAVSVHSVDQGTMRQTVSDGSGDFIVGGWELNTVTLLETGPWLTPNISTAQDQSNTNVGPRGALLRPDQVSNRFNAGQSRAQYFNQAAFTPTPAGAGWFGNAGVGILQGPGTQAVSLGLAKVYKIGELGGYALNRRSPMC